MLHFFRPAGVSVGPSSATRTPVPDGYIAERPKHAFGGWLTAACRRVPWREIAFQAGVLLVVAVLTRATRIGNPALTVDEQFYLLVGDRIWQGALPFVDIWDRKPVGLFLLYAAFRPFSADGIVAYQVAALVFAASTALVLARISMRIAGLIPSTFVGALYLIYLPLIGGSGGQSPVFYNLFTALAAFLVVRCIDRDRDRAPLWPNGLAAMLLVGLAMQVKYMAVFEGTAFGATLLWLRWRTEKSLAGLLGYAASLVAMALIPTALAFCAYALAGHAHAFVSANFVSVFQKSQPTGFSEAKTFLVPSALRMVLILSFSVLAMTRVIFCRAFSPKLGFVWIWAAFALVEFFVIGHYYDHYAIPLLMPLVIITVYVFTYPPLAFVVTFVTIPLVILTSGILVESTYAQRKANVAVLTDVLAPYARKGCIYVNEGPPILYLTTRSCLPTAYAFPGHLADAEEAVATNAHAAMAALLRSRPSAIVTADEPGVNPRNADTEAMLARALASDYHLAKSLPDIPSRNTMVYVRNDL